MKKIINILIILISLFIFLPNKIHAENISISSIEIDSKSDNAVILSDPTYNGLEIESNIKFNGLDDYVKYRITIDNKELENYTLVNDSYNDYLSYTIENNNITKNTKTEVYLTVKQIKKVPINLLEDGKLKVKIVLKDENDNIINPKTGNNIYYILFGVLLLMIVTIIIINFTIKKNKKLFMIMICLLIIPLVLNATSKIQIDFNLSIELTDDIVLHNVKYKVIHKKMNLDGTTYTIEEIENKEALEESEITPDVKTYEHFKSPNLQTVAINSDGTTTVEYLYERNKYTLTVTDRTYVDSNSTLNGQYYYQTPITLTVVDKEDYMFNKWSNGLTGRSIKFDITEDTTIEPEFLVGEGSKIYWALQDNNNDDKNETLVISTDIVTGNIQGIIYSGQVFDSNNSVPWIVGQTNNITNLSYNVKKVIIEGNVRPTSTAYWFKGVGYKASTFTVNLSNLDVSQVTNMKSMFDNCGYNADSVNISGLNDWDTSKVTDMSYMFNYTGFNSTTLTIGNLNNWDTSNVTSMQSMFCRTGYKSRTFNIGNLSNWNTSNVTSMYSMFNGAGYSTTTWTIGNLSNWNVSNVTNMDGMFIDAGYKTRTFNLGDLSNWDVSNVTTMYSMFCRAGNNATTWTIGDLSNWDVSNVIYMNNMFGEAGYSASTFNLNLSNWNTSHVQEMTFMFSRAGENATTFNLGNLNNWNTSNVTIMQGLFHCAGKKATTWNIGDLSNWDVSNVTEMGSMFEYAGYKATTWNIGDLSNWDVSNVIYMNVMFSNAGYSASTFNLDLSNWKTFNVQQMSYMFSSAGNNATTWNVIIPKTNGRGINNTTSMMYGGSTNINATPPDNREFTLAN